MDDSPEPAILPMEPVDGSDDSDGEGWMDEVVQNPAIDNTKPLARNEEQGAPAPPPLLVPRLQLPDFPVTALGTARRAEPPPSISVGAYTARELEIDQMQLTARTALRAAPTSAEMHKNQKSERMAALNQARRREREGRKKAVPSMTDPSSVYGTAASEGMVRALQGGAWTSRGSSEKKEFHQRRSRPQTATARSSETAHALNGAIPGLAARLEEPSEPGEAPKVKSTARHRAPCPPSVDSAAWPTPASGSWRGCGSQVRFRCPTASRCLAGHTARARGVPERSNPNPHPNPNWRCPKAG